MYNTVFVMVYLLGYGSEPFDPIGLDSLTHVARGRPFKHYVYVFGFKKIWCYGKAFVAGL